ncbi:MAG TPA: hypothetical protein VJX16_10610 [Terriglobales bacterium]|nr:hypothetical protein [Terriglobales bacterium]
MPAGCRSVMKLLYRALLFILVASSVVHGAPPPEEVSGTLIFLESPDIAHLETQKLTTCLTWLVRELGLEGKDLPLIVVMHISERAGKAAGVAASSIRRNSSGNRGDVYYEFWIVGQGSAAVYAVNLEAVLERHFVLKLTDAEHADVLKRVVRMLNASVSVRKQ